MAAVLSEKRPPVGIATTALVSSFQSMNFSRSTARDPILHARFIDVFSADVAWSPPHGHVHAPIDRK